MAYLEAVIYSGQWEEQKHPRDHGKFSSKPGDRGASNNKAAKTEGTSNVKTKISKSPRAESSARRRRIEETNPDSKKLRELLGIGLTSAAIGWRVGSAIGGGDAHSALVGASAGGFVGVAAGMWLLMGGSPKDVEIDPKKYHETGNIANPTLGKKPKNEFEFRKTVATAFISHMGVSLENRRAYFTAFDKSFNKMPPPMRQAFMKNLTDVKIYDSSKDLNKFGKKLGLPGKGTIAMVETGTGAMHLDGAVKAQHNGGHTVDNRSMLVNYYSHEMGHVIDGWPKISQQTPWLAAWLTEIRSPDAELGEAEPPLSDYAMTSASEGFAEFTRLLVTKPEVAQKKFPKCCAVFKKNKLM
jgi:hypothetical protein